MLGEATQMADSDIPQESFYMKITMKS